ncbi:exosortase F system-associated membrane protein [Flavobacterium pedocola]
MRNYILRNKGKIGVVLLLVTLLAIIRFFEKTLFYDPFLVFFKGDFQNENLPEYNGLQLFFGLLFRYVLNTVISLGIIYVIFKEIPLLKFAGFLYAVLFVVLAAAFFGLLSFSETPDYMMLFYIRRFLIQPLFLVLFLPAFYYQKKVS